MRGFAWSHRTHAGRDRSTGDLGRGIRPFGRAETARRNPGSWRHPMTGQSPYDGFRPVDPGGPKTTRRDPPRETLSNAKLCSARKAMRSFGRPCPTRGPGRSVPPARRPSRGAQRRLPSPTAPPPKDAMLVTNRSFYIPRRARSPKNGHIAYAKPPKDMPLGTRRRPPRRISYGLKEPLLFTLKK
jgi:hypothetical protein